MRSAASSSGCGIGLVALRVVAADDRLEQVPERNALERELGGRAALRRDDPEPAAFRGEPDERVGHPGACLELVVERLVVGAVDAHELVDPVRRERRHLRVEARPADRPHQLLVAVLAAEHLTGRVPHRREDDRGGVDDGAVEIEEDDGKAHHGRNRTDRPNGGGVL